MDRAPAFFVFLQAALLVPACGDPSSNPASGSDKQGVVCSELPTYMCEEYPEECRPDEADHVYLGLYGCYATRSFPVGCSDRRGCDQAEWFAEEGTELLFVRGCFNNRPPHMTVISNPSSEMLAATETLCRDRFLFLDEYCSGFTGDECPLDEGCEIETRQVLDDERGCATGETYDACIRGLRFIAKPGLFEFVPCE